MITGLLLMMAGAWVAMFMRRRRWWFRFHKTAGLGGPICVLCGFAAAMTMITLSGGEHFAIPHTYIGLITAVFAIATPLLGAVQITIKGQERRIRAMHRWSGRFTLLMASATAVSGLLIIA
jgi:cytochrome c biogenesis protein ResB